MISKKTEHKITALLMIIVLTALHLPVHAEEDYSDTAAWTRKCSDLTVLNEADKNACSAYMQYMASKSEDLKKQLADIDQKQSQVTENISSASEKIADYQNQIASLTDQVNDLQKQIDEQNAKIAEEEKKEQALKEDVKKQIANNQSFMRLSKVTDIIMGASSFEELLRILNGLSMITQKSDQLLDEYQKAEETLKKDRDTLNQQKQEVQNTENDILAKSYAMQVEKEQLEAQKQELSAQYASTSDDINDLSEEEKKLRENQETARKNYEKALAEKKAAEEAAAKKAAEEKAKADAEKAKAAAANNTTTDSSGWNGKKLSRSSGTITGPSGKETYYNLPMNGVIKILKGAGIPGDYWVRSDGVKMYGSYILVAADQSLHPLGSIVETSLGQGIVGDTGTFIYVNHNQIDIAVTW
ncbi:MAG: hypothetical protein PUA69_01965 [Erysipelotrichaceae bacterium]|nr:hypothetical protein [Erysipelotrichaceae bacterium]